MKNWKKKNRHLDRAYYARNADGIHAKKEARRQWCVYRLVFEDGCFYYGSSCHYDLRFNAHKSLAKRGKIASALQRDFTKASIEQVALYSNEFEALDGEATYIRESMASSDRDMCLNRDIPAPYRKLFWVYVIQSQQPRDNGRPGFFYVGMTTDPSRRLREHNGTYADGSLGLKGGGKYTSNLRPWVGRALHGPYFSRSEALQAEYALKRQKRGEGRLKWTLKDSLLCRGDGVNHTWVQNQLNWCPPTLDEWRAGSVVDPT